MKKTNALLVILSVIGIIFLQSCRSAATDFEGTETFKKPGGAQSIVSVENLVSNYNANLELYDRPERLDGDSIHALITAQLGDHSIAQLKANMLKNALYITNNANYSHYGNEGLAYVWGSKNASVPTRPSNYRGRPNNCSQRLYGLDCSGFTYQVLTQSGLPLPSRPQNYANAAWFSQAKNWKQPLDTYLNCNDCYTVSFPEIESLDTYRSGDIVLFNIGPRVYHIGIVLKYNDSLLFFESGGNPRDDCQKDIANGPRILKLTSRFLDNKGHFILRVEPN